MKPEATISAVILAKNEENNIVSCLRSLNWCNQIIVIDDDSSDRTVDFAIKERAIVISRRLNGNFALQRNFGLEKAKGDWVLFLDADERVTKQLETEILQAVSQKDVVGFRLKRQDIFLGKALKFGETARIRLIRLARKSSGNWKRPVHEVWDVQGRIITLKQKIMHYPHPTITEFLEEINRYTDIEASLRRKKKEYPSWFETLTLPLAKMAKNYCFLLGFLDGFPGLSLAFMMSLHSLCVRLKTREA